MGLSNRNADWGKEIGTAIAVLRLEPNEIAARGFQFERGYDDLDFIQIAWLDDQVALIRHEGSPSPGTEVVVTAFQPDNSSDARQALDKTLRALDLSSADLLWTRPELTTTTGRAIARAWYQVFKGATKTLFGYSKAKGHSRAER